MRMELDSIHIPADEFIRGLDASNGPVELIRNGKVVATITKNGRAKSKPAQTAGEKIATAREKIREENRLQSIQGAKKNSHDKAPKPAHSRNGMLAAKREGSDENRAWLKQFMREVSAHAAKCSSKLTEREAVAQANAIVENARRQRAARAR